MTKINLTAERKDGYRKRKIREWLAGFICASPVILGVIIFTYYPAVQSFIFSFFDYDGFLKSDFIGFENFVTILAHDPDTWKVFGNTFLYAIISVPLGLVLGYLLALTVNNNLKGISVFRVLFYLPVIIPSVANGVLFGDMFGAGADGIFNRLLMSLGFPRQMFLTSSDSAMATFIVMGLWGLGGGMIIWLAAFKNIDKSLYESASLDGANAFDRVVHITIPMSSAVIFYNLVMGVIGSLQITSTLFVAGQDGMGPSKSLYFIAIKIYHSFMGAQYGYACAFAWILFFVIAVLTGVLFKTSKWVFYGEDN